MVEMIGSLFLIDQFNLRHPILRLQNFAAVIESILPGDGGRNRGGRFVNGTRISGREVLSTAIRQVTIRLGVPFRGRRRVGAPGFREPPTLR